MPTTPCTQGSEELARVRAGRERDNSTPTAFTRKKPVRCRLAPGTRQVSVNRSQGSPEASHGQSLRVRTEDLRTTAPPRSAMVRGRAAHVSECHRPHGQRRERWITRQEPGSGCGHQCVTVPASTSSSVRWEVKILPPPGSQDCRDIQRGV